MAILRAVSSAGCTLKTCEGRLFLSPKNGVSAEVKVWIIAKKRALIRFLEWWESDKAVLVYSRIRNENIIIAANGADTGAGNRPVVYRSSELPFLAGMSREALLTVHEVKRLMGGQVVRTEGEE